MKNKETPTSVRVARWSAGAALITGTVSMFNTVWTERPWWMVSEKTSIDTATSANMAMVMSTSPGPELGLFNDFLVRMEHSPISTWLIVGSVVIIAVFAAIEYFHRHQKNKTKIVVVSTSNGTSGPIGTDNYTSATGTNGTSGE